MILCNTAPPSGATSPLHLQENRQTTHGWINCKLKSLHNQNWLFLDIPVIGFVEHKHTVMMNESAELMISAKATKRTRSG